PEKTPQPEDASVPVVNTTTTSTATGFSSATPAVSFGFPSFKAPQSTESSTPASFFTATKEESKPVEASGESAAAPTFGFKPPTSTAVPGAFGSFKPPTDSAPVADETKTSVALKIPSFFGSSANTGSESSTAPSFGSQPASFPSFGSTPSFTESEPAVAPPSFGGFGASTSGTTDKPTSSDGASTAAASSFTGFKVPALPGTAKGTLSPAASPPTKTETSKPAFSFGGPVPTPTFGFSSLANKLSQDAAKEKSAEETPTASTSSIPAFGAQKLSFGATPSGTFGAPSFGAAPVASSGSAPLFGFPSATPAKASEDNSGSSAPSSTTAEITTAIPKPAETTPALPTSTSASAFKFSGSSVAQPTTTPAFAVGDAFAKPSVVSTADKAATPNSLFGFVPSSKAEEPTTKPTFSFGGVATQQATGTSPAVASGFGFVSQSPSSTLVSSSVAPVVPSFGATPAATPSLTTSGGLSAISAFSKPSAAPAIFSFGSSTSLAPPAIPAVTSTGNPPATTPTFSFGAAPSSTPKLSFGG
ncbi:hypothetical protein H4R33_007166, partial [Dimargaris cristalligena]